MPTLTYFAGLRSRGEPTQLIIAYGKLDMKVELIDFDEWGKRKGKVAPYMPYITEDDGKVVLDTEHICRYLGEKAGMVCDAKQDALIKVANGAPIQLADPHWNMPDPVALGAPPYEEWFPTAVPVLKKYADDLGAGPFFSGAKPGYADPFIWHNIDNCFALDKARFAEAIGAEATSKLEAFYAAFAAIPEIAGYLKKRPTAWGVPGSKANPQ